MKALFAEALGHFLAVRERRVRDYVDMSRAGRDHAERLKAR